MTKFCYCGRPVESRGAFWQHADDGDRMWCYPEEKGLDDESRCNADWSGDTLEEGSNDE